MHCSVGITSNKVVCTQCIKKEDFSCSEWPHAPPESGSSQSQTTWRSVKAEAGPLSHRFFTL